MFILIFDMHLLNYRMIVLLYKPSQYFFYINKNVSNFGLGLVETKVLGQVVTRI